MRIDVASSQLAFDGVDWLGAPSPGERGVLVRDLGLLVGIHTGTVDLEIRRYDSPPELALVRAELADWDDVVVVAAMLDDDARIRSLMSDDPPGTELGLGQGLHAVLLARDGVDASRDGAGDSDERILVVTWPTEEPVTGETLQLGSASGRAAAAPPPPPLPRTSRPAPPTAIGMPFAHGRHVTSPHRLPPRDVSS